MKDHNILFPLGAMTILVIAILFIFPDLEEAATVHTGITTDINNENEKLRERLIKLNATLHDINQSLSDDHQEILDKLNKGGKKGGKK